MRVRTEAGHVLNCKEREEKKKIDLSAMTTGGIPHTGAGLKARGDLAATRFSLAHMCLRLAVGVLAGRN